MKPASLHQKLAGALILPLLLAAAEARADGIPLDEPSEWWRAWNWQPALLLGLALLWWLYSRGLLAVWDSAGVGRGVSQKRAVAFGLGIAVIFIALVSPIDAMSGALSSAHMAQHMLIMMVAAPLLAFGSPLPVLVWSLPQKWRRPLSPWIRRLEAWNGPAYKVAQPLFLWLLYALALWIWHIPAFYQAALRNQVIHDFQHIAFLGTSYLFWQVLLDPLSRLRLSKGVGVLYLFTTCLHASALGIFLTLSPRIWYMDYQATVPLWRLTPLEDQQLAGVIMWVPGCLIYAIIAAAVFAAWLREPEAAAQKRGAAAPLPDASERGSVA